MVTKILELLKICLLNLPKSEMYSSSKNHPLLFYLTLLSSILLVLQGTGQWIIKQLDIQPKELWQESTPA